MPELHGAQLPSDGLHVAIRYDVPDQPSRDALVLTPDDVGALLLQRDVSSIFALVSVTPVTWSQIPDGESTLQAIIAINALVNERVVGPAASNDNAVPVFDGTTGKLLKESLASIDSLGNLATPGTVDGVDVSDFHNATFVTASPGSGLPSERVLTAGVGISLTPGAGTLTVNNTAAGASAVQGPIGATDTAIALFDGSTGALIKESLARVDNLGNITTPGTVDGVDVSNLALAVALVAVPDYVTLSSTPTLGNERTLTAGAGITITDDGPGGAVTVTSTGGAPAGASYVTLGANATLTSERVLTAGTNITITDGGAGGPVTIASTAGGGGAPTTAQYLTLATDATLTSERVLTAGTGVTLTDGGAGGTLTVATPSAVQGPASANDGRIVRYSGTTGKLVKDSIAGVDDAGTLATASLNISGNIVVGGTVDGVDVSALATTVNGKADIALTLNNQTGTTYTLAIPDQTKCVTMSNAAANTVTIPANASVAFAIGTVVTVMQIGTGQTTIAITTDTLLNPSLTAKLRTRYSVVSLTKITATSWVLSGDLAAS